MSRCHRAALIACSVDADAPLSFRSIHIYCSAVDAVARSEGIAALGVQSVSNLIL